MNRKPILFLVVILLLIASAGFTQEDKIVQALKQMSIEELMNVSVVSASKYEQTIVESPTSIKVITADEIKAYGWQDLSQLIQAQAGFSSFSDRIYNFIVPRGYYQSNDPNSRILVLIDGHSMVEFFGYYNGHLGSIDMDHIEKVEIIKGPNSAIYGTNAMFAVINVITRKADTLPALEINTETGNFGHAGLNIFGTIPLKGNWYVQAYGSFITTGKQAIYFKEYDDSLYTTGGYSDPEANVMKKYNMQVQAGNNKTSVNIYNSIRNKEVPTGIYGGKFGSSGTYFTDINHFAEISHREQFGKSGLKIRFFADGYEFKGKFRYYKDTTWINGPPYSSESNTIDNISLGTELNIHVPWTEKHTTLFGVETRQYARLHFRYYSEDDPRITLNEDFTLENPYYLHSAFLTHSYKFNSKIYFDAGFHFDYYTNVGSHISPRATVSYEFISRNRMKLMYGEAFRSPNFWELNKYGALFSVTGNPDLKPELLQNYEILYQGFISNSFNVQASLVYYKLSKHIQVVHDPISGSSKWENTKGIECKGIETEITYKYLALLSYINASYYAPISTAEKKRIAFSPEWMIKAGFMNQMQKLKLGIECQVTGNRLKPGSEHRSLPAYTIVNVNFAGIPISRYLFLSFAVYNLLDTQYENPSFIPDLASYYMNASHPVTDIPANGRELVVKVEFKLGKTEK